MIFGKPTSLVLDEARERIRKKAKVAQALKNFPEGQELLTILEEEFAHKRLIVKGDTHATYANIGARDVLDYLHELINHEER